MKKENNILNTLLTLIRKLIDLVLSAFLIMAIIAFVGKTSGLWLLHNVIGSSMEPNFNNGDYVISTKIYKELKRYDVVVVNSEGKQLIKRVIGLPGETIKVTENGVLIDGEPLNPSYVTEQGNGILANEELDEGEYYVLGDNRPISNDSRSFGPITSENIESIVIFQIKTDDDKIDVDLVH